MVLNEETDSKNRVYSLSWSEFGSSLSNTAQNLRCAEDLTDVTISAGGKIFPAHKLILSSASPLLMELLKNTKCQHPILLLAGISATAFEIILDFVYRGEINIDSDKLPSVLQAAQLLDIRALLPTALVLMNSLKHDTITNQSTTVHQGSPVTNRDDHKVDDLVLKRKTIDKQSETHSSKITKTLSNENVHNTSHFLKTEKSIVTQEDIASPQIISSSSVTQSVTSKLNDANSEEARGFEEKKIISDLPVNCKLCGVTIRQSRNLRRHIDQMHSKVKFKLKNTDTKRGKQVSHGSDTEAKNSIMKKNVDNVCSPSMDELSQDSFSQLTEEILSYSAGSESEENSFPNTVTASSTSTNTCIVEDAIRPPHTSPSDCSTSSSSIVSTQTLPTLLEDDICFQLSSKRDSNTTNISQASIKIDGSPVEQFETSHLDDACHVNDIALKELENQLFSACFCSTESI